MWEVISTFHQETLRGNVRRDIIFTLEQWAPNVEMSHREVAPGQHEIDFKYAEGAKDCRKPPGLSNR